MILPSHRKPFHPADHQKRGPVRVAFLSHTSGLGGAERVLLELVDGLLSQGVDCVFFLPSDGPLEFKLRQIGVPYRIVKYSWWSNPVHKLRRNLNNVLAIFRLARAFNKEKIDLVFSNTTMIPSGALAAKLCGLPHIWHAHEFGKEDHGLEFDLGEKVGMRLIGALSFRVICVSNAVRAKYGQYIEDAKLATVYATITLREGGEIQTSFTSPSTVRCVLVGVLRPSKGQKEAIEAIHLLVRDGFDIGLTLVGSGEKEYEAELRELIASKNLNSRVEMVGQVENPFPYVANAHIVLMCSKCEAFARAVLEAMFLGKPIVGSRSGGTVEAVQDHFNGLLYTPGNIQDLVEKIRILAADLDYARRLGENGREWAERTFTADNFVGGVSEIIHEAVRGKAPALGTGTGKLGLGR
jgi:glycosyltransferase involved in cell wall biosynthesis